MNFHKPVLVEAVQEALRVRELVLLKKEVFIIDATVGLAGHTFKLVCDGAKVLGIDADKEALEVAEEILEKGLKTCPTPFSLHERGSYKLVHGNFRDIDEIANAHGFDKVDGVLFDLGVSTAQLTSRERGFSFQNKSADLDMRVDKETQGLSASDLLNSLRADQLTELFNKVLSASVSKKIAQIVVRQRAQVNFKSVGDFLKVVEKITTLKSDLNPATLPFLALRIAVNSEIENLKEALPKAFNLLSLGGRLVIISFHSGEDRVVKEFSKDFSSYGQLKIVTKKPFRPNGAEIEKNPSARSAKMRIFEKI